MATVEISCVEVWREISNYIEGDLDAELRQRMAQHFKSCAHCSAVLDGAKNVLRLVADGRSFEMPSGFSERLKQRLAQKTSE